MEKPNVLILDDEPAIRNEIEEFLVEKNFNVFQASLPSHAFSLIAEKSVDIAIVDIRLPEMNGIEVLEWIKKFYPSTEVIMITGFGEMETVIHAMRLGAIDFFNKPFRLKDLDRAIQKTRTLVQFQCNMKTNGENISPVSKELQHLIGHQIISESSQMKEVLQFMKNVASANNTNVLITGESGTGKELIAKGIHYLSERKNNPFQSVNCSSIPEELFESEFFGHTKGAFTGAIIEKKGWFEASHKGILFMDEIGDLKLSTQPKFLRVLDDMTITPLGSTKEIKVDVRIIAATNQNLEKLMEEKRFRYDLYYRMSAFTIHISPLRERKEDIIPLFYLFLQKYSTSLNKPIPAVDSQIYDWLLGRPFPGNVRELKHMVERALILCHGPTLTLAHFIRPEKKSQKKQYNGVEPEMSSLSELEKQSITRALKEADNIKTRAAHLLNISRQALDRKMEKYGLKQARAIRH
jgi:DNA-binding NtrC family response regulator